MATPKDLLWERDPHTAAKHTLLRKYLDAWFPIMASHFREKGITFLDGFAGPGAYTNSSESSPAIALAEAHRAEVTLSASPIRLVFIESNGARCEHLRTLLDARFPASARPHQLRVTVHHGECHDLFDTAIAADGGWDGPVFANLDGWGVDTRYDVVRRIAEQRSSEVLVTFQDQFLKRFANNTDQEAGDRVFGDQSWRDVGELHTSQKTAFLLDLYRTRLKAAGFTHVLTFEMLDEGGHALYQFFGTTSEKAVEKFKDGLWEVDGVQGQRFRDPRNVDQLAFEMNDPDFGPLEQEILRLLEEGPMDLERLSRHALLETIYKPAHAKPVVDRLVEGGRVRQVSTGRSYTERVYGLDDCLF